MKTLTLIIAASLALSSSSFAAKKPKGGKSAKGAQGIGKIVKGFDANSNNAIDGDEVQKLKDAFTNNTELKPLDKNSNGSLDDDEIAAINKRMEKAKGGKKGKKGDKAGKKKGKKKGEKAEKKNGKKKGKKKNK